MTRRLVAFLYQASSGESKPFAARQLALSTMGGVHEPSTIAVFGQYARRWVNLVDFAMSALLSARIVNHPRNQGGSG